jgi:hypothetical protein
MNICPAISTPEKKQECLREECAWWVPSIQGVAISPECAIHRLPSLVNRVESAVERLRQQPQLEREAHAKVLEKMKEVKFTK